MEKEEKISKLNKFGKKGFGLRVDGKLLKRVGKGLLVGVSGGLLVGMLGVLTAYSQLKQSYDERARASEELATSKLSAEEELAALKARDEYQINQELEGEIESINETYKLAAGVYEKLFDAIKGGIKVDELEAEFAKALSDLAERNYASASDKLKFVASEVDKAVEKARASVVIPANVPADNSLPGNGYRRQKVVISAGEFLVDLVAADLNSTRVIVDTASDGDCSNECPVLSLGDYVARNGAFAGINGSYFCPAAYPSCAGKTNSFDTLLMNKNKVYFNSDNNVYSNVPAVIFGNGWVRFVGASQEWGRDTSVDGVLANQALLVSGGRAVFGGDGDPKKGSRGNRSFVGTKGSSVYIGVMRNVTVAEMSLALAEMGMEGALNLDSGGSTALWSGGYKVGPGRNIPNAILLVGK